MKSKKQPNRTQGGALDGMLPAKRPTSAAPSTMGIRRRTQNFPEVGKTLATYNRDAFSSGKAGRSSHDRSILNKRTKKHRRLSKKKIVLLVLLPFLIVGGYLGVKFGINAGKIFQGNLFSILSTSKLDGEDQGRVNILLAGNSADDIGHNGGNLTDSIMIVSIDTRNNKALMLSIPRDLYVDIPGYGYGKINEAYVAGENQNFSEKGYASGGMGLLQKTIQETIGVKSNYYGLVNYTALRDTVNAIGGIDVVVSSTDKRGLYDPSKDWTTGGKLVKLSNGPHHLNGQQALNLSRARGEAYGSYGFGNADFTRTENQRMILLAIKKKVFTSGVLANPVKMGSLSDAMGSNIESDMELSEFRRLYDIMKKIPNSQIQSYGLNDIEGRNYLDSYRTRSGQSTLVPAAGVDDYSEIRQALRKLMSSNPIVLEGAKVVVLNATDVNGAAGKNANKLEARNVTVTDVADADDLLATSRIIAVGSVSSKPKTLALLKGMYGQDVTTQNDYARVYPEADFIVLVGADKVR